MSCYGYLLLAFSRFCASLRKLRLNLKIAAFDISSYPAIQPKRNFAAFAARNFTTSVNLDNEIKQTFVVNVADSMLLLGDRCAEWFTGKHPTQCPGYVLSANGHGVIHSLPQISCKTNVKALQAYFDNTWCLTETLFASLQTEESFIVPPYHDLRHPMIFYYGHPAALYVNKLRCAGILTKPINEYYESIFETGICYYIQIFHIYSIFYCLYNQS